jgi:hypothetical protein
MFIYLLLQILVGSVMEKASKLMGNMKRTNTNYEVANSNPACFMSVYIYDLLIASRVNCVGAPKIRRQLIRSNYSQQFSHFISYNLYS